MEKRRKHFNTLLFLNTYNTIKIPLNVVYPEPWSHRKCICRTIYQNAILKPYAVCLCIFKMAHNVNLYSSGKKRKVKIAPFQFFSLCNFPY